MNIAIIGGGAAGFFAAINLKEMNPNAQVVILEATSSPLAKVLVSGGGRCNLTNSFEAVDDLSQVYPRGHRLMKQLFRQFDFRDTKRWFEDRGIRLVTQPDNCLFPASQQASQITETFIELCNQKGVKIYLSHKVTKIKPLQEGYELSFANEQISAQQYEKVIVTVGGKPRREGFELLEDLQLKIIPPLPSLFSFNIPNDNITALMGAVVENATVSLQGTKLKGRGALLITHWGMSGPAVLKLSSYAARELAATGYQATIAINWIGDINSQEATTQLQSIIKENSSKLITNIRPFNLPTRLWNMIIDKAAIAKERRFGELGSKGINRLINLMTNDEYQIKGQSKFREEFVTCGGVDLSQINPSTMESKKHKGLYFAGEVLDLDAITGGFNLQGAWSMGYAAANSIAKEK